MDRRIVITGLGTVNPVGKNVKEFWDGIVTGKSGIGPMTKIETDGIESKVAAEILDFKASDYMNSKAARKMAEFTQYGVVASIEAIEHAGLKEGTFDPERMGCVLGVGIGGFEILEDGYFKLCAKIFKLRAKIFKFFYIL